MATDIQIEVRGLRELMAKMALLPDKIRRDVVRQSLREGAKVMLKPARANAPFKSGTLRRGIRIVNSKIHNKPPNIGIFLAIKRRNKDPGGRYRPTRAQGAATERFKNDPFYGKFQEDGFRAGLRRTKERIEYEYVNPRSKKKIKTVRKRKRFEYRNTGKFIPGKHFLQSAYNSTKSNALQTIVRDANQRIERVVRELGG